MDEDIHAYHLFHHIRREQGLGSRVVLQLKEPYRHKNYHVFCDNFFSSPTLFDQLLDHGLYACGMVGYDRREFPSELKGIRVP